jgi:hypothetical protein
VITSVLMAPSGESVLKEFHAVIGSSFESVQSNARNELPQTFIPHR